MDIAIDGALVTRRVYFNELSWPEGVKLSPEVLADFSAVWKTLVRDAGIKNMWSTSGIKERFALALSSDSPKMRRILLPIVLQAFHKLCPIEAEGEVSVGEICRYNKNEFVLLDAGKRIVVSKSMLAWSCICNSPSVAFPDGPFARLHLKLEERDSHREHPALRSVFSVSKLADFNDPGLSRWIWAMNPRLDVSKGIQFTDYEKKHFAVSHFPRPDRRDWSFEKWVTDTQDGVAVFRPGLAPQGDEYLSILHQVLCAAYDEGRFEATDLNGFICQVKGGSGLPQNIGAAGGKPTSLIEVYITAQNVLHLRPKEERS